MLALGNLSTNQDNFGAFVRNECIKILISYAFPSTSDTSTNAQFEAIGTFRGLATHQKYRKLLISVGVLKPMIVFDKGGSDRRYTVSHLFGGCASKLGRNGSRGSKENVRLNLYSSYS